MNFRLYNHRRKILQLYFRMKIQFPTQLLLCVRRAHGKGLQNDMVHGSRGGARARLENFTNDLTGTRRESRVHAVEVAD